MAKALKEIKKVVKTVEVEETEIVLRLSVEEAEMLCSVLGNFDGAGTTSPIFRALREERVNNRGYRILGRDYGTIDFLRLRKND